jgi:hypothetical protein
MSSDFEIAETHLITYQPTANTGPMPTPNTVFMGADTYGRSLLFMRYEQRMIEQNITEVPLRRKSRRSTRRCSHDTSDSDVVVAAAWR